MHSSNLVRTNVDWLFRYMYTKKSVKTSEMEIFLMKLALRRVYFHARDQHTNALD